MMYTIQSILAPALAQLPAWLLVLSMVAVSLVLIFAGRTLVKVVAFLAVGLAGAGFGGALAAQYLSPQWGLLGVFLGFVIGGLLGVVLLPLGVGLAVGYAGYLLALDFALGPTAALVAGVAFFVAGALLSGKILSVGTAVAGGFLLFDVLTRYTGVGPDFAVVVSTLATVAGLWVQLEMHRRTVQPTTTNVGGQPGDRR